jgi:hypothetical protein
MKCNDCGEELTKENVAQCQRGDICNPCWNTRGELVAGKIVQPGSLEFIKIQRKMSNGRGTAKRYIDTLRIV